MSNPEPKMFTDHLERELRDLYALFEKRWPKYKDSWKHMGFHELVQRLVSEHSDNKGEFTEFMEAIEEGASWQEIKGEALDSILVLFFIVQYCNKRIDVVHEQELKLLDHDARSNL
jgi:NTP pyrophosphatase (non-canonical NTP hydrolase)